MEDILMTTASSLEGYVIVKQCGIVFGETFFKNSALDSLSAGISNMVDSFRLRSTEMTGQLLLQPPHIDQKKTVYPVISNRSILT